MVARVGVRPMPPPEGSPINQKASALAETVVTAAKGDRYFLIQEAEFFAAHGNALYEAAARTGYRGQRSRNVTAPPSTEYARILIEAAAMVAVAANGTMRGDNFIPAGRR